MHVLWVTKKLFLLGTIKNKGYHVVFNPIKCEVMTFQEHKKVVSIRTKDSINGFYKMKASNKRKTCLWQKLSLHQLNYGIKFLDIWIIKFY
jgi:hypothetical protein